MKETTIALSQRAGENLDPQQVYQALTLAQEDLKQQQGVFTARSRVVIVDQEMCVLRRTTRRNREVYLVCYSDEAEDMLQRIAG